MTALVIIIAFLALFVPCMWFAMVWFPKWNDRRKCFPRCHPEALVKLPHGGQWCPICKWKHRADASTRGLFHVAILIALLCVVGCGKPTRPAEPVFDIPQGPMWNDQGYALIIDCEVGGCEPSGGREQYEKHYRHPIWPKFASGVTWGIGYDGGYSSRDVIHLDWHKLPFEDRDRLAAT